jgi:hypothetical protein
MITPAGVVTTLAGNPTSADFSDGIGGGAIFNYPYSLAVDSGGNIYVADTDNSTVRKMTLSGSSWIVTTIGGTPGSTGTSNGLGFEAEFYYPGGVAVDSRGNVYVADTFNGRVSMGSTSYPVVTSAAITGSAGSAFSYQIIASNTPTSYNATGLPAGLTINTATGLITGTTSVYGVSNIPISASNQAGTGTATLTLTVLRAYDAWKAQKFTPPQLLNPAISGDSATPSGDGISNLIKYALGLNPNMYYSSSSVLPYAQLQTVGGTKYLTLTFTQNTAAADVTYSVEASTTLSGTWTEINPLLSANQVGVLPDTPSAGINTITVKDTQPASASTRRFMRLRITNP